MSSRRLMIALAIGSMKLSKYTRRLRFTAIPVSLCVRTYVPGFVPAISCGTVPRPIAGTRAGHDGEIGMDEDPAPKRGLARNTANYGDSDFALYLRRSFAKSMGYSQAMLDRPVVGIVDTGSG